MAHFVLVHIPPGKVSDTRVSEHSTLDERNVLPLR
jgi:hypothetical protein